jgi:hypothetical protein
MPNRRTFLKTSAAAAAVTALPNLGCADIGRWRRRRDDHALLRRHGTGIGLLSVRRKRGDERQREGREGLARRERRVDGRTH